MYSCVIFHHVCWKTNAYSHTVRKTQTHTNMLNVCIPVSNDRTSDVLVIMLVASICVIKETITATGNCSKILLVTPTYLLSLRNIHSCFTILATYLWPNINLFKSNKLQHWNKCCLRFGACIKHFFVRTTVAYQWTYILDR